MRRETCVRVNHWPGFVVSAQCRMTIEAALLQRHKVADPRARAWPMRADELFMSGVELHRRLKAKRYSDAINRPG